MLYTLKCALLLTFENVDFRAFAVEVEAVELNRIAVEIHDFVFIKQIEKIVKTVDVKAAIFGFEMHGDNDVGHKFIDVFFRFLRIDGIVSPDGDKKDVCGDECFRKHCVAFLADVAEMAHFNAVKAILEHKILSAQSSAFLVVVGKKASDVNAFDLKQTLFIDNNGVALDSFDEVVILVIMTECHGVARNFGHRETDVRVVRVGDD